MLLRGSDDRVLPRRLVPHWGRGCRRSRGERRLSHWRLGLTSGRFRSGRRRREELPCMIHQVTKSEDRHGGQMRPGGEFVLHALQGAVEQEDIEEELQILLFLRKESR